MKLNVNDLPRDIGDQIKKENGVSTRNYKMNKNQMKSHCFAVLNQLRGLNKSEINRVLEHAKKMNEV